MPRLVKMYLVNVAVGFGIAGLFMAILLGFDVAGIGRLVMETQQGWIAGLMLFMASGTLFAGVQFALRVMALAESDDHTPRGGLRQHAMVPVPVRVTARRAGAKR